MVRGLARGERRKAGALGRSFVRAFLPAIRACLATVALRGPPFLRIGFLPTFEWSPVVGLKLIITFKNWLKELKSHHLPRLPTSNRLQRKLEALPYRVVEYVFALRVFVPQLVVRIHAIFGGSEPRFQMLFDESSLLRGSLLVR